MKKDLSLLFVCLGNICRSPAAEQIMRDMSQKADLGYQVYCDSAGTHATPGFPPDVRMSQAAMKRGFKLAGKSRKLVQADYKHFDYIFTMDEDNYQRCVQVASSEPAKSKVHRLLEHCAQTPKIIEDPYYGGNTGFEQGLDRIELACHSWLEYFKKHH